MLLQKDLFCSSFMNFEPPTNFMGSSFLEAIFIEDVGNMVVVEDDDEWIVFTPSLLTSLEFGADLQAKHPEKTTFSFL